MFGAFAAAYFGLLLELRCCHRLAGLRLGGFLRFSTLSSLRQAKIN